MLTSNQTGTEPPRDAPLNTRCKHPEPLQHTLFSARDYITGDHFTLRLCHECSLVRTTPHPRGAEKDRYYPPEYYGEDHRFHRPVEYILNRLQASRSGQIHEANAKCAGRALDIGCGRGLLLHQLRRLGWNVTGTELSNGAARFAREVLRLDVRVGDLGSHDFEEGAFDAVVLWHVLEHVDDPASFLHDVNILVRPGGFLLLAVPNFGSDEAKLWKAAWFHLDVPRHLSHFTSTTLGRMLERAAFTPERISYFSPEYDYFSFIQSALNALGVQQNSLYELLRTGPAKLLHRRGTYGRKRDAVASLVLSPLLGFLALVVVPVAAWRARGATMIVYARKP